MVLKKEFLKIKIVDQLVQLASDYIYEKNKRKSNWRNKLNKKFSSIKNSKFKMQHSNWGADVK